MSGAIPPLPLLLSLYLHGQLTFPLPLIIVLIILRLMTTIVKIIILYNFVSGIDVILKVTVFG